MKSILPVHVPVSSRPGMLVLGALIAALAILAGASGLIFPSPYSPLLFLGGIAAVAMLIAWLVRPVLALYAALFLVFLPYGLIPANIQSMLNRYVTVIAAVAWLVPLIIARKKIVFTGPALLMLFFLAWSSITVLWAERTSSATSALQVYSLRFLLFLFLVPNAIRTKRDLDGLMKTLALIGWVLMLLVVITLLVEGYTPGSRLHVLSANENAVGMVALVAMVGVVWQQSQDSKNHQGRTTLIAATYILLTFGLVAMSGSRGSALALLTTFTAFWLWKPLRPWGKVALLILILAVVLSPWIFTTLIERFAVEQHDTLLGGREVLWQAAWLVIEEHPLGGIGIGNAFVAHNPILTIWSETGIPGILLYLGVLTSAVYLFVSRYLESKRLARSELMPYFAVVSSVTLGYMISWVKGGGLESDFSYFLIVALLSLPSVWNTAGFGQHSPESQPAKNGD